jgi:hypothetical protein
VDTDNPEWFRCGAYRVNLVELAEHLNKRGFTGITARMLEDSKAVDSIPHVQIGRYKWTKAEWVAEWLESLKTPRSQPQQQVLAQ